jgi:hypothetical protein
MFIVGRREKVGIIEENNIINAIPAPRPTNTGISELITFHLWLLAQLQVQYVSL